MATSTEQISDLIAACTDLKAYFEGARDRIEDAINNAGPPQIIYVDAVSGSDLADGGYGDPVKTLGRAIDMFRGWGRTVIYLPEGQSFDTLSERTSREINVVGPAVLEIARSGAHPDDGNQPTVTLANKVINGENGHAAQFMAYAPFYLNFRSVNVICEDPGNAYSFAANRRELIRSGHNLSGMNCGCGFNLCTVTITPDSLGVLTGNYRDRIDVGFSSSTLTGNGTLVRLAQYSTIRVGIGVSVSIDGTTSILDSGTVGQNVLTNDPAAVF